MRGVVKSGAAEVVSMNINILKEKEIGVGMLLPTVLRRLAAGTVVLRAVAARRPEKCMVVCVSVGGGWVGERGEGKLKYSVFFLKLLYL